MISEAEVERALDYMRNHSSDYAKAKAERIYLEQYRKTKKAVLVQQARGTVQERESFAYGHPDYVELLEGLKVAVENEEKFRWMIESARVKVEVWRTQQANSRRIDRAHQ
jgi:hypothetical protein